MSDQGFVVAVPRPVSLPVAGTDQRFPVRRIYCVGRNYEDHAKEMGFTGREPPFFFIKPADTAVVVSAGETAWSISRWSRVVSPWSAFATVVASSNSRSSSSRSPSTFTPSQRRSTKSQ